MTEPMAKKREKKEIITGYGQPARFYLSVEAVKKWIKGAGLGAFVKRLPIDESGGGIVFNTLSGKGLTGYMYEFEKGYFVVWSCGEYIDFAVFRK